MNNCIILGSGRSGTSMLGGILFDAGYFMGEDLYEGRDSNPKGFFENAYINGINEYILAHYDNWLYTLYYKLTNKSTIYAPAKGQHWLMALRKEVTFRDELIEEKIINATKHENFAYKDPRFSYTLSVWEPYLKKTVFIVIFRNPSKTVSSILKECATTPYLSSMQIDEKDAYKSWNRTYSYILNNYDIEKDERFFFIHYDQVLDGSGLAVLEKKLECKLSDTFVDNKLNRSKKSEIKNKKSRQIYSQLCQLAGYID